MAKAVTFYTGAKFYQEAKESAMAMFMLQQAAELTFRTVAIALYGMERRTHSIRSLKKLNRRLAPQLNSIFPADTEIEEHLLKVLEDAYLDARYAENYTLSDEDMLTFLSRVENLIETAQIVFNARMSCFDIAE
ncbi:HEPN domain-containing protein [Pedobacter sp. HMF7056]|uniref:HEPN domain-containing protein n=1 Tax=Hufsiella ginkgonis TaxID=2695274 RepID=A0A7K1Y1J0_9SPHI|nr:HEPN domain-containing protein [Hufsiella ginkgonis]